MKQSPLARSPLTAAQSPVLAPAAAPKAQRSHPHPEPAQGLPDIDRLLETLKDGGITLFGMLNGNPEANITATVIDDLEKAWKRGYNFSQLLEPLRNTARKLRRVEAGDPDLAADVYAKLSHGLVRQISRT